MSEWDAASKKDRVLLMVQDLVSNFFYYDRKEDEEFRVGVLEKMIEDGEIAVDDIVDRFREMIVKRVGDGPAEECTELHLQVAEFHREVSEQPILDIPMARILDGRVRLRARLISEEFLETISSMFAFSELDCEAMKAVGLFLNQAIGRAGVRVDLPALADGLGDLDYVIEGTRLEFGINGLPVAREIHRANMAKKGGPISPEGKRLKPPDWKVPDIRGVLIAQGWIPET